MRGPRSVLILGGAGLIGFEIARAVAREIDRRRLEMPSFNPTLVRLAQEKNRGSRAFSPPFQSHLGSISTTSARARNFSKPWFQSHLGSISTRGFPSVEYKPDGFQSHLGSISTVGSSTRPRKSH